MIYDSKVFLDYWNTNEVESMYDKHLIRLEIKLIKNLIPFGVRVLDAGCGEGEETLVYSKIPNTEIVAADFSETRLKKAKRRLKSRNNVVLKKIDFLSSYNFEKKFDVIICQRFLINITSWKLQKKSN